VKFSELLVLRVGHRVVARDVGNRLQTGTVAPVPHQWRTAASVDAFTVKGDFAKVWVRFAVSGTVVPCPGEDVFTDIDEANAAVAAHERASADR
jgi:hypothetical protein